MDDTRFRPQTDGEDDTSISPFNFFDEDGMMQKVYDPHFRLSKCYSRW